jgi:hypothetical protein
MYLDAQQCYRAFVYNLLYILQMDILKDFLFINLLQYSLKEHLHFFGSLKMSPLVLGYLNALLVCLDSFIIISGAS